MLSNIPGLKELPIRLSCLNNIITSCLIGKQHLPGLVNVSEIQKGGARGDGRPCERQANFFSKIPKFSQ